jgi:cytochrome c
MFGMDSFEFNKIAGAVLGTLLFVMGLQLLAGAIYAPRGARVAGYALPAGEEAAAGGEAKAGAAAPAAEPLPVLLAKADPAKGQAQTKACQACHSFEKGGPNKVGPHLWGIVGADKAHSEGFEYSAALKEMAAKNGKWGFEELDKFLTNPKGYVPGTKMAFAGIPDAAKRAEVIAYLRTLSDSPVALPKP